MAVAPVQTPTTSRSGPRRRGSTLRRAIFDAVFDQLQTVGYANLTMDGVAAAAHTGKAALYRRWPSKDDLVMDALKEALRPPEEVVLQGELRADILALLKCVRDAFNATHGTAFQIVSASVGCDRGFVRHVVTERILEPCVTRILDVLRLAAERGEVAPEVVSLPIANVGPAMLVHHSLAVGPTLTDDYLATIVDDVVMPLVGGHRRS